MSYTDRYAVIINKISGKKAVLGKKKLQKLMYLMERKGVDLNLNYSIHFYGPYSSKLDNAIQVLAARGVITINTNRIMHEICVNDLSDVHDDFREDEKSAIVFVLDNFSNETANDLEALTTLDFVANNILSSNQADKDIIKEVERIKGSKFTPDCLQEKLGVLKDLGFLNSH